MKYIKHIVVTLFFAWCFGASIGAKNIYITARVFGDLFDTSVKIGNAQISCYRLQQALQKRGHTVKQCLSIKNLDDPDSIIFFDLSDDVFNLSAYEKEKAILFLWEPPSVKPVNYDTQYHHYFSKIFTWNDSLVDNKKYFKFHYPQPELKMIDNIIDFDQKKLCTLIACYKGSSHSCELYSERVNTINFFNRYYLNEFDLYGIGWPQIGCYKGEVDSKIECLKFYKFCICYENAHFPGYVTEKIFDCFVAGCVPVYWGADNIDKYVPQNCFIDRRNFATHEQLYDFLVTMPREAYQEYVENIRVYLHSQMAHKFSSDHFINTFINGLGL